MYCLGALLLILFGISNAQPPPQRGLQMPAVGEVNVDKIGQMYGIATQLMSLTSEFMQNGRGAYGAPTYPRSGGDYGGNSILNEVVSANARSAFNPEEKLTVYNEYGGLPASGRPQSGIQSILNTFLGSSMREYGEPLPPPPAPKQPAKRSSFFDLFGLGATDPPTTTTTEAPTPAPSRGLLELFGLMRAPAPTTTTRRPSSLLNMFAAPLQEASMAYALPQQQQQYQPQQQQQQQQLQPLPSQAATSFYSPPRPMLVAPQPRMVAPQPTTYSYSYDQYGRAPPPSPPAPQSVLPRSSQDDPFNPRSRRQQRYILDAFLGGGQSEEPKPQRQAPIVDMLEMFGLMETTTTTQRPKLFDSRSGFGMGSKGASDIDSILNALMRGGARSAEPEQPSPAGILSQFFG